MSRPSKAPWEKDDKRHFTVVIDIQEVIKSEKGRLDGGTTRDIEEFFRVVVRGDTIDEVVNKTIKHLEVVSGEDID